jgi:hypothetical protein
MFVLNEVTSSISPLGTGDVTFDESNVESYSEVLDVNEQMALLDAIDLPYEEAKSGAPSLDVSLTEEPESLSAVATSVSDSVEQTTSGRIHEESYMYTHALRCVLCIVVIIYMH